MGVAPMKMGKLAGGMAGVVLGIVLGGTGPAVALGLMAGLAAGYFWDERHDPDDTLRKDRAKSADELDREARRTFAKHLATLLIKVAEADGNVGEDEVQFIDEFVAARLQLDDQDAKALDEAFVSAKKASLEDACKVCRETLGLASRMLIVSAMFKVAATNGKLTRAESSTIARVAELLEIPPADVDLLRRDHVPSAGAAYERLGLDPSSDDEALKRSFKRLIAQHHPDRVAHLGPGAQALAEERFRDLQTAWDEIRQERGL